jgi:hypothetical protein
MQFGYCKPLHSLHKEKAGPEMHLVRCGAESAHLQFHAQSHRAALVWQNFGGDVPLS